MNPDGTTAPTGGGNILVCFAVEQEAGPLRQLIRQQSGIQVLLTGMGQKNAEAALRRVLALGRPEWVLTCGFAGGLDPALPVCTVVFPAEDQPDSAEAMVAAGARPARFLCVERILVTKEEKAALRQSTGADVVEMESAAIRAVCEAFQIPCATVRVISDAADEDLPLDFGLLLMTPDLKLNYLRLARALLANPGKIPALIRLQRQTRRAANKLAEVIANLIAR